MYINKRRTTVVKKTGKIVMAIIATILALGFSVVVTKIDVRAIGETNTEVGLSHLNEKMFNMLGTNMTWYEITKYLGYVAIAIAAAWALVGLVQWIKRKNILAVDVKILALGVLYSITIGLYVAFTKIMINGRPIILPEETAVEPSFPSSHTMLVCVVSTGAIMILADYITNKGLRILVDIVLSAMAVAMIVGRLLSGAHWFTDIVAGILIAGMLLAWYGVSIAGMSKGGLKQNISMDDYHPRH